MKENLRPYEFSDTRESGYRKRPAGFYCNHPHDETNPFSIAARILAQRNIGVTLSDTAFDINGRVVHGSFAEYVAPEILSIRCRIDDSPEVMALYYINECTEIPDRLRANDLSPIDPDERIAAAKLLGKARLAQYEADIMFKTDPIKATRYDVRAVSARLQAKWILEKLPSIVSVIEQVADREFAQL